MSLFFLNSTTVRIKNSVSIKQSSLTPALLLKPHGPGLTLQQRWYQWQSPLLIRAIESATRTGVSLFDRLQPPATLVFLGKHSVVFLKSPKTHNQWLPVEESELKWVSQPRSVGPSFDFVLYITPQRQKQTTRA